MERGLQFIEVISVTPSANVTTGTVTPATTNDGISAAQTLTIDLGTINNTNNDSADETIVIEYRVRVANADGVGTDTGEDSSLVNSAAFQWDLGGSQGTQTEAAPTSPTITVIEPDLDIIKNVVVGGSGTEGDAGDSVVYTIDIDHAAGSTDAFDAIFADAISSKITWDMTGVTVTHTDTGSNTTNLKALFEKSGNTLQTISGNSFDLLDGESLRIIISGNLNNTVISNETITNTATVTWTSVNDGEVSGSGTSLERDGQGTQDDYTESSADGGGNDATIEITAAEFNKYLFSTDQTETSTTDVTIGEVVTYALRVKLSEGTTPGLTIVDQLPPGLTYNGFRVETLAANSTDYQSNVLLANDFAGSVGTPTVTTGGADGDDVTFTFGSIVITTDNDGGNNEFLLLVDAVVSDVGTNIGYGVSPTTLQNIATLDITGDGAGAQNSNTIDVDVVEPNLAITKEFGTTVDNDKADAGETLTIRLTVANTGDGAAYDVSVQDVLNAAHYDTTSVAFVTTPSGFVANNASGTVTYAGGTIAAGATATFEFRATLLETVTPAAALTNTATIEDGSTLDGTVAGERNTPDADGDGSDSNSDIVTVRSSSVAGIVFQDNNNDGTINGSDAGIGGVTVKLDGFDNLGNEVHLTTTTSSVVGTLGEYLFDGLRAGVYTISETQPTTHLDGRESIGTQGGSTGSDQFTVNLPTGTETNGTANNFAELAPAQLDGFVYHDVDNDGNKDVGESGIESAFVRLTGTDDLGTITPQVAETLADGSYSFTLLRPGTYKVEQLFQPTGYLDGKDADGSLANGDPATNDEISSIEVTSGQTGTAYNFGEVIASTLSGFVYHDSDNDGDRSDEPAGNGIAGVTMTVSGTDDLGVAVSETATTDGNGFWEITGLRPSNGTGYTITEGTVSATYIDGKDTIGSQGGTAANDVFTSVIASNSSGTENNFGEILPARLAGRVFNDFDNDGTFDSGDGETGISGVSIRLTGTDDLGNSVDTTIQTLADGTYEFTNLRPSNAAGYTITETHPTAYTDGIDSDGSLANGDTTTNEVITSINVSSGDDGTGYNFAERGTSINGAVFVDDNRDGDLDAGEGVRIGGVTVELFDMANPGTPVSLGTTVTGVDGTYSFDNLPGGDYRIVQTQPTQYGNTSANTVDLTLPLTGSTGNNFGEALYDIGDVIYFDADNNGTQNGSEEGLADVTVTLQYAGANGIFGDGDDPAAQTDTTDANGAYSFTELFVGNYRVSVTAGDLPDGVTGTEETDDAAFGAAAIDGTSRVAISNADRFDADFGYTGSGTIGNFVWIDINGDGIQDANEPGLDNVTVDLTFAGEDGVFGNDDDLMLSTVTAGGGAYTFANLPAGDFRIAVDTADTDLPGSTGGVSGSESVSGTANVTLATGVTNNDIDFGFTGTLSVGDRLWLDQNGDGVQDASEPGLPDVGVTLVWFGQDGVLGGGDDITLNDTTDSSGNYGFTNLPDGNFRVTYASGDLPDAVSPTFEVDGTTNNQVDFALNGSSRSDIDFGFSGAGSIGDFVFFDTDGDGVQDATNEPGLAGVDVILIFAGADGNFTTTDDNISITVTTDSAGAYSYAGLPDGDYRVAVDTGDTDLPGSVTPVAGAESISGTANVTLNATQRTFNNIDFGFTGTQTVGDFVWLDTDGDGNQDAGEPGLGLVDVTLVFAGQDGIFGNADDVSQSTTTDANGAYGFSNLADGDYRVTIDTADLPVAVTATEDVDGTLDNRGDFSINGANRADVDFGYAGARSLGDRFWYDADADGNHDAGEPGITGIDVTLTFAGKNNTFGDADDFTLTTTTNATGTYSFNNLPEGDYRVTYDGSDLPSGMNVGTTEVDDASPTIDGTANVGLGAVDRNDVDFGFAGSRTLGDFVFFDANSNGAIDANEPGFGDVDVNLLFEGQDGTFGTADDVTLRTVTAADGSYSFANLPNGDFQVSIDTSDLPAGVTQTFEGDGTTNNQLDATISGGNIDTADFGFAGTSSIGNFVWLDADGDGVQDSDEPGLANVTINLTSAGEDGVFGNADDFALSTVTSAAGAYSFYNLPAGEYRIAVDTADTDLPGSLSPVAGTESISGTANVTLSVGQTNTDIDFGFTGDLTIGDRVWYDGNGDSVQDATNEPGIFGVDVILVYAGQDGTFGTADDITKNTTTTADGAYSFSNLSDGDYRIAIDTSDLPTGATQSYDVDDPAFTESSDDTARVTLAGANRDEIDFGYTGGLSLGDTFFHDVDADGSQSVTEPGIAGVEVTAAFAGADDTFGTDDDFALTTTTNGTGDYLFDDLFAGNYRISFDSSDLPSGMNVPTAETDDAAFGAAAIDGTSQIALSADRTDVDFGFTGARTVGDRLWFDANGDGVQDANNEPGFVGVEMTVVFAGPNGVFGDVDDASLTTITGADGSYSFSNLPNGTFRINYDPSDLPAGIQPTYEQDGTTNNQAEFTISGTNRDDIDFGFNDSASISNQLWYDVNGDGVFNQYDTGGDSTPDTDEPGLAGVTVTAISGGSDGLLSTAGDNFTLTTTTAADGTYFFDNLPQGEYTITVDTGDLPTSFVSTHDKDDFGTVADDGISSVALGDDETDAAVDFGFRGSNSVGNVIWFDRDGDGVQDSLNTATGEPGLGGVTVTLTFAGADGNFATTADNVVLTTTTDTNGAYQFDNLFDGDYRVAVNASDLPTGLTQTHELDGVVPGDLNNRSDFSLSGGNRSDIDFGYVGDLVLGDTVFYDADADGGQDAGEPGISGVDVVLTFAGADDNFATTTDNFTIQTTTNATGAYTFGNLPSGEYRVSVVSGTLPLDMTNRTAETDDTGAAIDGTSNISLAANRTDVDFGFAGNRTVGDVVWFDQDGDGTRNQYDSDGDSVLDTLESGFGNVEVTLLFAGQDGTFGSIDDTARSTTTAADGSYTFANIPNGDFRVSVDTGDIPSGTSQTFDQDDAAFGAAALNDTANIRINGSDRSDVDFGYNGGGAISDFVWLDVDADGVQDTGEPGLAGISVDLVFYGDDGIKGTADDFALSTFTNSTGGYSFENLPAGQYEVSVDTADTDLPTGLTPVAGTESISGIANVTLGVNETRDNIDFGFAGTRELGDTVFFDFDNNGVQNQYDADGDATVDTLEPGIGDVAITLLSAGQDGTFGTIDDFSIVTTTDADGDYNFANLPDADYRVSVFSTDLPTGSVQTADQDDAVFGAASLDNISRIRINGGDRTDADFGYTGQRTLGDRLWHDANADGLQTAGEPGIAEITINAVFAGEDGIFGNADDFTLSTITAADGTYSFANLPQGDYRISYDASDLPSGMTANSFDVDTTTDGTSNVTVGVTDRDDVDFGFAGTLSIGDRLWFDFDGDGAQDATNEPGLVGVDVTLLFVGPDGTYGTIDDATLETTTGADGAYTFENLPNGSYRISYDAADLPGNATDALTQTFEVDTTINNQANVALSGSDVDNVDFGFIGNGSISDYVWIDVDGDGLQEAGEPALVGVDVIATFAGADGTFGNADDFNLTVATDINGQYSFGNLPDGNYRVAVDTNDTDLPGSLSAVSGTQSNSGTVDLTLNGTQRVFTNVDFGFVGTNTAGDFVWFDADGDGVQDATNEPGLGLVDLTLTFAGQDGIFGNADDFTLTTTTDANGAYSFGQLPDGDYRVAIDTADLPTGTTQTAEQNDSGLGTLAHTAEFTVNGGSRSDIDFGYFGSLNLGDTVWYDVDGNGAKDAGEPGLSNIDVNLSFAGADDTFGTDDDFVLQTTTIASGAYNFANLPQGDYRISVAGSNLPSGMNVITAESDDSLAAFDGTSNINLTTNRTDMDFGFRGAGSLGDRLWFDGNGDGIQDATNEPGLGDVRVNLLFAGQDATFGTADDVTIQDTTDASGNYGFTDLPNGDYRISVENGDLPAGMSETFEVDGTTNNRADVTIAGNDTDIVDFGFGGTGTISDRVWHDVDGDGTADAGEPGLAGVTVNLAFAGEDGIFGTTDDFALTTTTDTDGGYSFNNLPAGDYRIDVVEADIPASRSQTFERNDSTNAIPGVAEVSLSVGQVRDDVGFAYTGTLTLGDRVWFDANNDGLQTAGEPGIPDVAVTLTYAGPDGFFATTADNVTLTATTDSSGNYDFEKLFDGNYTVAVTTASLPGGAIQTADHDDPAFGAASLDHTSNVGLSAANRSDADFGYRGTSSIGDLIFFDVNNNSTLDAADRGLPGIDVTAEVDINGDSVVDYTVTVTTDINGAYTFENLIPGSYTITVDDSDLPPGMIANPTVDPNGTGTPHTTIVNLGAGETNTTTDFGYNSTGTIGDRVWLDSNGDGVQDATNEPGLANVDVTLTWFGADGVKDAAPGGDDEVFTTTTNDDGNYAFEFLAGGNYEINVDDADTPGNTALTTANDGIVIALAPGASNDTINFGFQGGATGGGTIGDRIFYDFNGDGIENGDDIPYPNVDVTITADVDGDGVDESFTATTNAAGFYEVAGLPYGSYTVSIAPPNGTSPTIDATGAANNQSAVTLNATIKASNNQDFGLTGTGTVGDTIFYDEDGNGVQGGTEVGIPGVTVTIEVDLDGDGNSDFTTTAVTDQDGKYSFTNIPEGEVTVTVATPGGSNATTDHDGTAGGHDSNTINLTAGVTDNTSDFGYLGTGSIGDTIFFDADADGSQDDGTGAAPSEPGLPNVQVFLDIDFNGDGTVDHTLETTTDLYGNYSFDNLPAGDYTVRVTQPTGTTQSADATGLLDNRSSHTLGAGEDNTDQIFGYAGNSSIGDIVFFDVDNDGTLSAGDRGLPGVLVTATVDLNGDSVVDYSRTVMTGVNGEYRFDNLVAGTYLIEVDTTTLPDGMEDEPTYDPDGFGTPHQSAVNLGVNEDNEDQDFGYNAEGVIGDMVWLDQNANQIIDGDETGIAGVEVILTWAGANGTFDGTGPTSDDEVFTVTTNPMGFYLYTQLPGGNYQVAVNEATLPSPLNLTTVNNPIGLTLPTDDIILTADFGYVGNGVIGDRVFYDFNGDGIENGDDTGYAGIAVKIAGDFDADGEIEEFQTTTDATGFYQFVGLGDADYTVTITPPKGTAATFDADGHAATPNSSDLTLGGASLTTNNLQDFGLRGTGSVGDTVFFDEDGNGVQNGNEVGIPGINVRIDVDLDGDGVSDFNTTVTTDADGRYSFDNLPEGQVTVTVSTPVGSNPTSDHDGDSNGDSTNTLNLTAGDTDNTSDFGFRGTGSIGDIVYFDADSDQTQDDGTGADPAEPGLPNVSVSLDIDFNGDGNVDRILQTSTGADGSYVFENLPVGYYTIRVTQPTGTAPTVDGSGPADNESFLILGDGEDNADQDFGYTGSSLGQISDTVYFDIDDDATDDSTTTDRGLPNVDVTLTIDVNGDGSVDYTDSTTTDADGNFTFTNLIPGTYTIETDPNDMPLGLANNPTVDNDGIGTPHSADYDVVAGASTGGPGFGFHATPNYDITKTGSFSSASPGDIVNYTIVVKNIGELDGRAVTITDNFPTGVLNITDASGGTVDTVNGTIEWTFAALAPNQQQILTVTAEVIDPIASGIHSFTNSVTVDDDHYNGDDPDTTNNTASHTATLDAAPDYSITKNNGSGIASLQPGGSTSYTITITNDGNQDGTGVVVTDRFPVGVLQVTDAVGGTVDALSGTITWNIGNLEAGDSVILQPVFDVVTPGLAGQHNVSNQADVADDDDNGIDPTPGNNTTSDTDTLDAVPDYRITKTLNGNPATIAPDDVLTYSIFVENIGNQNGTGVVVTDMYPTDALIDVSAPGATIDTVNGTITWNIGNLDGNGDSVYLTVTARVRSTLPTGVHVITNEASVTDDHGNGSDPTPANNINDDTTPVTALPDLTIEKSDGDVESVRPGETVVYTITYSNEGLQEATGVVITETVPEGSTFESSESTAGWVDQGNGTYTFGVSSLPAGAGGSLDFAVTVSETLDPNREELKNIVTIVDDGVNGADLNADNNVAADTTPLQVYTFDSFQDFSGNQNDLFAYNEQAIHGRDTEKYANRLSPLPIDTVYTGIVDPGTTLSGKIYDDHGRLVGEQIVVADSAGNWLMQFPTVVLYEAPHEMRIDQTLSVQNSGFDAGFNMRRFFHPAVHGQLYMNEPISIGAAFRHDPFSVLAAMHAANNNPLGFGWQHHAYELMVSSSNASSM